MKNLNKIKDIDFDALLRAAKAKHKKCLDTCKAKAHSLWEKDRIEFRKAQAEWERWCRVNLTDRGIDMTIDAASGEPRGLFIVVAGKKF